MLPEITNIMEVERFMEQIAGETANFHPLSDFYDYVRPDSYMRRYTDEEAEIRNRLLEKCFAVCAGHTDDFFTYLQKMFERVSAGMNEEFKVWP